MRILDVIWPWGALRRVRANLCDIRHDLASARTRLERYHEALFEGREAKMHLRLAKDEIKRLRAVISEGHFRNPATGRLGKKGQIYS